MSGGDGALGPVAGDWGRRVAPDVGRGKPARSLRARARVRDAGAATGAGGRGPGLPAQEHRRGAEVPRPRAAPRDGGRGRARPGSRAARAYQAPRQAPPRAA
ncbi:hypothetical protein ROR02_20080 [Pararhodospirillum oryzae]|uniref:Uncharacterized protein n=1 Tax=Pararhodospirillum oryzae TaxID=478448 RepID=A0A512H8U1_9PROT|nr:hypothetical protein ROR02_20080 [Pararhodospirillum oryzae]